MWRLQTRPSNRELGAKMGELNAFADQTMAGLTKESFRGRACSVVSRSFRSPTLVERLVGLVPLPYPWAALIWAIVLPSGLGFDLLAYLGTGTTPLSISTLPNAVLNLIFVLYAFLMIRYLRSRIVAAEAPIVARLSGESEDYDRAFGRMSQTLPVIIMTAFFGTLILVGYAAQGILANFFVSLANVIVVYLGSLVFLTLLWEFAVASWGLHKLGGSSLRLGSFLEDRMMGVRPMGNLALSMATAYFGIVLLAALLFSTINPPTLATQWPFIAFLILGVALFFLPLNSIHAKMQAEKRRLLREINARYPSLRPDALPPKENATMADVQAGLAKLTDLQEVEMLDRRISSLPTWPFDVNVASKFIAIILSVTAVLLSRLITNFLHI